MAAVRDLGYVAWKDPRAWMEAMRGPRWQELILRENAAFQRAVRYTGANQEEIEAILTSFQAAQEEEDAGQRLLVEAGTTRLSVVPRAGGLWEWRWELRQAEGTEPSKANLVGDLDVATGGWVYSTVDVGGGSQSYQIIAQQRDRRVWTRRGVGQQLALLAGRLYALEETAPLQFTRLVSLDARTGDDRRVLYEEKNPSIALSLVRGENECLFLLGDNAGVQQLWHIRGGRVVRLSPDAAVFIPIGYAGSRGDPCYFTRSHGLDGDWVAHGEPLASWKVPADLGIYGIDLVNLRSGILVSRNFGTRTLSLCGRRKSARWLQTFIGELEVNPWSKWRGDLGSGGCLEAQLIVPGVSPTRVKIYADKNLEVQAPAVVYGSHRMLGRTPSRDGVDIPWVACWNKARGPPRRLLVSVYGAYGISTSLSMTRWKPYLERGWAVGLAMIRGGGDSTERWAEDGRRDGKAVGVDDLVACIRGLQSWFRIPAKETVLYGRSAGGYVVGAALARYPRGDLVGTVYTEVPYVDVLRTSTNPKLPLTAFEYYEFGNPKEHVEDMESLLKLSPIEALSERGAPGVFVLCRTATRDKQVYAYEAVKWIDALRKGGGKEKLLAITEAQGHFAYGEQAIIEKTEDFLLIQ